MQSIETIVRKRLRERGATRNIDLLPLQVPIVISHLGVAVWSAAHAPAVVAVVIDDGAPVPGCVGGNEGGPHELTGMIIHGEQEGLFLSSLPPLMDGRVVLPELVDVRSLPSASGLGVAWGQAYQVGKAVACKRGNGLTMSLEAKACCWESGSHLSI